MSTIRSVVKALLAADATFAAAATGGVYDRRDINRTQTPAAYNSTTGELKPCAVVVMSTSAEIAHREVNGFEQTFFFIYYYAPEGNDYAAIATMQARARALLHNQTLTITDGRVHDKVEFVDSPGDLYDDVLGAEMSYDRFMAYRKRT